MAFKVINITILILLIPSILVSEDLPPLPKPELYYIEDNSNQFTLKDIIKLRKENKLTYTESALSLSFTTNAVWIYIPVPTNYRNKVLIIENTHLDRIEVFSFSKQNLLSHKVSGDLFNFNQRFAKIRYPNFSVDSAVTDLYIKVSTQGALTAPVKLMRRGGFYIYLSYLSTFNGFFLGFWILAMITSLVVYYFLQEKIFLQYSFILVSLAQFVCTYLGLFFEYLWPQKPHLNNILPQYMYLTLYHLVFFNEKLLNIRNYIPGLYKIHKIFYFTLPVLFILFAFVSYSTAIRLIILIAFIAPVLIILSDALIIRKLKSNSAKIFIGGWVILTLSGFFNTFYYSDLINERYYDVSIIPIGVMIQILTFTIVVLLKINELNKEKEQVLLQHNRNLESLVDNRTSELVQKQNEIKEKNLLLKNQQIHLKDQVEKKTSELQKKLMELQNSEERFRFLADEIPQLLWVANEKGQIEYVNKRFIDYTGIKDLNQIATLISLIHPEDKHAAISKWEDCIKKRTLYESIHRYYRKKDNCYRWQLVRSAPWQSKDGNVVKWFGTSTDVDEQIKTREKLTIANEELRKVNEDMDSFLYVASHELKAPVANMLGLITAAYEVLKDRNEPSEGELWQLVRLIEESIVKMNSVVQDLDEISKVQRPGHETPERFNLKEELDLVLHSLDEFIKSKKAKVTVILNSCDNLVYSKENFRTIVYKIINNSLTYSHPNRVPEIGVLCSLEGNFLKLTVSDNGIGITKEGLGKLFKMFRRAHDHVRGKGISLYMIRRILTNSGGKIDVESQEGVGCTFKIYFPVKEA